MKTLPDPDHAAECGNETFEKPEKTFTNLSAKKQHPGEAGQSAGASDPDPALRSAPSGKLDLFEALDHQFEKMFRDPPVKK